MKTAFLASALLISSMSFACPSIDGSYTCKDERDNSFEQSIIADDNSVNFLQGEFSTLMKTDGKFHAFPENQSTSYKATCQDNKLTVVQHGITDRGNGATNAFMFVTENEVRDWGYVARTKGFSEYGEIAPTTITCIRESVEFNYVGEPQISENKIQGDKDAPITLVAYLNPSSPTYKHSLILIQKMQYNFPNKIRFIHKYSRPISGAVGNLVSNYMETIAMIAPDKLGSFTDLVRSSIVRGEGPYALEKSFNYFLERNDLLSMRTRIMLKNNAGEKQSIKDSQELSNFGINGIDSFIINGNHLYVHSPVQFIENVIKQILK